MASQRGSYIPSPLEFQDSGFAEKSDGVLVKRKPSMTPSSIDHGSIPASPTEPTSLKTRSPSSSSNIDRDFIMSGQALVMADDGVYFRPRRLRSPTRAVSPQPISGVGAKSVASEGAMNMGATRRNSAQQGRRSEESNAPTSHQKDNRESRTERKAPSPSPIVRTVSWAEKQKKKVGKHLGWSSADQERVGSPMPNDDITAARAIGQGGEERIMGERATNTGDLGQTPRAKIDEAATTTSRQLQEGV